MHLHRLDLVSLTWGIILAAICAVLGLAVWTDMALDLGVIVPAALICTGGLVLIAALTRRDARDDLD